MPLPFRRRSASKGWAATEGDIKDFEVLGILGTGGFGVVHHARYNGADFALKTMDLATNLKTISRSKSELRDRMSTLIDIWRDDKHPRVLDILGWRLGQHHVYVFLQLCRGSDLFVRIQQGPQGRILEPDARKVAESLGGAINWLHARGIIHRDVKPENIYFEHLSSPFEDLLLADFDSSIVGTDSVSCYLGSGGTLGYVAPEVASNEPFGQSADMFSYGITMYEVLSGRSPIVGNTPDELRRAVIGGPVYFPNIYWASLSIEAKRFVQNLLQRDPRLRMTAEQVLLHPWLLKIAFHRTDSDGSTTSTSSSITWTSSTPPTATHSLRPFSGDDRATTVSDTTLLPCFRADGQTLQTKLP